MAGTMSLTGQEKLETAPTDKRFPTTNQAKHCYMCVARAEPASALHALSRAWACRQVLQLVAPVQV